MKVLIDARSLGDKPSGIGKYVYTITLVLLKNTNYKIELITDVSKSKEMQELKEKGIAIYEYGKPISKSLALFSYYRFVQKCISEVKPDIFWECNTMVPINITNPYGKLMVTIHDMFPLTQPGCFGRIYPHYFKYGVGKTIKNFDVIIYNSEETKRETHKWFPKAKEVEDYILYSIVPRLPKLTIVDNNCFLYIGNLEKRKGTDLLLKAYEKYRNQGGTKGLRLGGKIREQEIEELLDQVKLNVEGIEYLGYVSDDDRNREYASCAAFVFPSRAEGFGVPILEAMNYYKPIIASNLTIFEEIVGNMIEYVDIGASEKVQIENLVKKMMNIENIKVIKEEYDEQVYRYDEDVLGKKIMESLERIIENKEE